MYYTYIYNTFNIYTQNYLQFPEHDTSVIKLISNSDNTLYIHHKAYIYNLVFLLSNPLLFNYLNIRKSDFF